jgi:hypothetical protein
MRYGLNDEKSFLKGAHNAVPGDILEQQVFSIVILDSVLNFHGPVIYSYMDENDCFK